jgi:hypothetical protein
VTGVGERKKWSSQKHVPRKFEGLKIGRMACSDEEIDNCHAHEAQESKNGHITGESKGREVSWERQREYDQN